MDADNINEDLLRRWAEQDRLLQETKQQWEGATPKPLPAAWTALLRVLNELPITDAQRVDVIEAVIEIEEAKC